jgi:hypothetical protein
MYLLIQEAHIKPVLEMEKDLDETRGARVEGQVLELVA